MGKSLVFCTIAMVCYGLEIAVADWKLAKLSPRLLTFCYALGVAACAGLSLLVSRERPALPAGPEWAFLGLMILASFAAALAHFAALHAGAGAVALTLYYCLLPVVASAFAAAVKREIPDARLVLAWLAAVLALALVSGSTGAAPRPAAPTPPHADGPP